MAREISHFASRRLFALGAALLSILSATQQPALAQNSAESEPRLAAFDSSYLEPVEGGALLSKSVERIIASTNAYRQSRGLGKVSPEAKLTKTAQYFAAFMARTEKYGHEADGNRPAQRIALHQYDYCLVAENIAYLRDPAGVSANELAVRFMKGWKESKAHRENMLDPPLTEIGVAIAQNPNTEKYYVVQVFGRPKSASIRFQLANKTGDALAYTLAPIDGDQAKPEAYELPQRIIRTHSACRPQRLRIKASSATRTIDIAHGKRYLVRTNDSGIEVVQESMETAESASE